MTRLAGPRPKISAKLRAAVLAKTGGVCACGCGEEIGDRPWQADHIIEHALDGPTALENLEPLLEGHHRAKTSARAPALAKTRRLIRKADPKTRKPPRMKGKPFQTALTKGFDGKVRPRRDR